MKLVLVNSTIEASKYVPQDYIQLEGSFNPATYSVEGKYFLSSEGVGIYKVVSGIAVRQSVAASGDIAAATILKYDNFYLKSRAGIPDYMPYYDFRNIEGLTWESGKLYKYDGTSITENTVADQSWKCATFNLSQGETLVTNAHGAASATAYSIIIKDTDNNISIVNSSDADTLKKYTAIKDCTVYLNSKITFNNSTWANILND